MKQLLIFFILFFAKEAYTKENLSISWKQRLVLEAQKAQEKAYAPYSNFYVGSAVLAKNGKIFHGVNVENASYGLTNCAERAAIFSAISSGETEFEAIAIIAKGGFPPCGACRQVLNEFNPDMLVIIADETGTIVQEYALSELLLQPFGPKNLNN